MVLSLKSVKIMLEPEELALIEFKTNPRAKRLRLTASKIKGIELTAPQWVNFEDCKDFLNQHRSWIKEHLEKINSSAPDIVFHPDRKYKTFKHELVFIPSAVLETKYRISANKIKLYYNESIDFTKNKRIQDLIKNALVEVLRSEAKEYLPSRVAYLAFKNKLKYKNLFVKNMKSQWGSCSYENNINLSLHLMRLPVEIIDYVILHELAHTIEKNHSQKFWALVEKFMPNAKQLDIELKNYHPEIY